MIVRESPRLNQQTEAFQNNNFDSAMPYNFDEWMETYSNDLRSFLAFRLNKKGWIYAEPLEPVRF